MMKRKLMLATLALMIGIANASAFTKEQSSAIAVASAAQYAGLDNHCPRFKLDERARLAELHASGLTDADLSTAAMNDERGANFAAIILKYEANPSDFCNTAWQMFGPNGLYKRQMLEAK